MVERSALRQEQLYLLSLEEITERWGEQGLREQFAFEAKRFSGEDSAFIDGALELATFLHDGEQRVREPYINHVLRVTLRILQDSEFADIDVIVAAILHDTVENHHNKLIQDENQESFDSPTYELEMLHAMALDILQSMFNERVARLVNILTNPPLDPAMPRGERHELYRANVLQKLASHPDARIIKACDVLDNTADLELILAKNPLKATALAKKYEPMLRELAEIVGQADTPLSGQAKLNVQQQLANSAERCRRIAS